MDTIPGACFSTNFKGEPRGPKPPKPIRRSTKPLDRSSRASRVRKNGKSPVRLQEIVNRYVRMRDPICTVRRECSGAPTTEAAHILSVGAHPKLRFRFAENITGACAACHRWGHRFPEAWRARMISPAKAAYLLYLESTEPKADKAEARATVIALIKSLIHTRSAA